MLTTTNLIDQANIPLLAQVHIPGYRHLQDSNLIHRLDGDGNYTRVTLVGQERPLLVAQTLTYFEEQLPHFIRASKSTMIHPAAIEGVIQQQVVASRRRIPRILQQLSR